MLQYNIFGMVFSLYKSRNLSPCQKCCTYNIYGRPLQIILTGDLSHARLLCAKCCTCSNFSRVIQPQPHVSAVYLCISMLQQMIMKHCSHGYESIESRCSSPIPRLETLCCLKFVSRVCEQKKEGNTRFSRNIAHGWQQLSSSRLSSGHSFLALFITPSQVVQQQLSKCVNLCVSAACVSLLGWLAICPLGWGLGEIGAEVSVVALLLQDKDYFTYQVAIVILF